MSHSRKTDHRNTSGPRIGQHVERSASGHIRRIFAETPPDRQEAVASALKTAISGEVRFDIGSRALYSTDASNYRQVPIGIVIPRSIEDVVTTVDICHRHDVPIVLRGGGTSLAGQTCNVAVVIDFSKYLDDIIDIDPLRRLARVEPGCILDTLRQRAERHHLTFGPDPATHDHNTLGNNSCGVHSVMAGRTSDNVETLEVLTYDGLQMQVGRTSDEELTAILEGGGRRGEIYRKLGEFRMRYGDLIRARYPKIPRRVSGYENLDELLPEKGFNVARALVGTEATCVTILSATLKLVDSPPARVLVIVGFEDIFAAADAVPDVLRYGPIGLEGIDEMLIDFMRKKNLHSDDLELLPARSGWLLAEFGGESPDEAAERGQRLADAYRPRHEVKILRKPEQQARIWNIREAALAATAHVPGSPEAYPGWEDSAVGREQLGNYLRDLKALYHRHGYRASIYGHFGDGLVHSRIPFRLHTEDGLRDWQRFLEEAADLVAHYGGSLSGEHGDGQARAALLQKMYGAELIQAFREFKAIWDPTGRMNPGKVVDPFPPTSNLREGPDYAPMRVDPYFAYAQDGGSFERATRRCVGVGKCRRLEPDGGVMCPSYMVTREEKHSTRGRARLLFEMMRGDAIVDGWKDQAVEDALDLCLACKGCKSDCSVQVDMATYKSEFRAHHYRGRVRPRAAYSMGLIHLWSRLAGHAPRFANTLLHTPLISGVAKWSGGIASQRTMPRYARQSFIAWFHARGRRAQGGRRVMLWPDTFNNYFRPETAMAATRVLEHMGYDVVVPGKPLCCARPLYDWGMLDRAKRLWRDTLDALGPEIEAGTPLVGLEPACVSSFLDELPSLFPEDERAQQLSRQVSFFSDFIGENLDDSAIKPGSERAALVQVHCHHHASIRYDAERKLLERLGVHTDIMPSGCCGMAGAFGFEREKYDLSLQLAERVLLPCVRAAPSDTVIMANGFSCREQIEQGSGRHTKHIAELLSERI